MEQPTTLPNPSDFNTKEDFFQEIMNRRLRDFLPQLYKEAYDEWLQSFSVSETSSLARRRSSHLSTVDRDKYRISSRHRGVSSPATINDLSDITSLPSDVGRVPLKLLADKYGEMKGPYLEWERQNQRRPQEEEDAPSHLASPSRQPPKTTPPHWSTQLTADHQETPSTPTPASRVASPIDVRTRRAAESLDRVCIPGAYASSSSPGPAPRSDDQVSFAPDSPRRRPRPPPPPPRPFAAAPSDGRHPAPAYRDLSFPTEHDKEKSRLEALIEKDVEDLGHINACYHDLARKALGCLNDFRQVSLTMQRRMLQLRQLEAVNEPQGVPVRNGSIKTAAPMAVAAAAAAEPSPSAAKGKRYSQGGSRRDVWGDANIS
ncbi:hypothetical protein CSUB01_10886 [Colletotrichum sublineola]|uniref:Uncharacterized protein n=1 Tax=Colletotrichum sublineola TaxID=1173701 RepID=A0A066XPL1_COLSU|nr:hypothetical protein CSUB01_10886 [Colletotrichum sublineola]